MVLLSFAGWVYAEDDLMIQGVGFDNDENAVVLEFKNQSAGDLVLIDRFDLKFGVIKLRIEDSNKKQIEIDHPSSDWAAKATDRIILQSGQNLKRSIKLPVGTLKSEKYRFSVIYEVKKNSYFLYPFFEKALKTDDQYVWIGSSKREVELKVEPKNLEK